MRFSLYCTCGASAQGSGSEKAAADFKARIWDTVHTGPDHRPCDAKTAARARRAEERGARANGAVS